MTKHSDSVVRTTCEDVNVKVYETKSDNLEDHKTMNYIGLSFI